MLAGGLTIDSTVHGSFQGFGGGYLGRRQDGWVDGWMDGYKPPFSPLANGWLRLHGKVGYRREALNRGKLANGRSRRPMARYDCRLHAEAGCIAILPTP